MKSSLNGDESKKIFRKGRMELTCQCLEGQVLIFQLREGERDTPAPVPPIDFQINICSKCQSFQQLADDFGATLDATLRFGLDFYFGLRKIWS